MSHRLDAFLVLSAFGRTGRCILVLLVVLQTSAAAAPAKQPSKVAYVIRDRAAQIAAILQPAGPEGELSTADATELSDDLLPVNRRGEMLVELHAADAIGEREESDLADMGCTVELSSADLPWPPGVQPPPGFGMLLAWVRYDMVGASSALPWVVAMTPAESNPPDAGQFHTEGVELHRVDPQQFDGSGATVGVVSDGVTNLAASQALGELPPSVAVLPPSGSFCGPGSGDEGTALLEIVHDMAPGAALLFCSSGTLGTLGHASALLSLANAGANVVAEDIPFDAEPVFQKGALATLADMLASAGTSIHSSAGNLGNSHAARVPAVGTGAGPDGVAGPFTNCVKDPTNVVDIDPGPGTAFDVILSGRETFTLQWSEPRSIFPTAGGGGFTDLDLYLMDSSGTNCLLKSLNVQGDGSGNTIEQISAIGGTGLHVKIVVNLAGSSGAVGGPPLIDLRWRGAAALDSTTRAGSLNPDSNYTGDATSAGAVDASVSIDPETVPLEPFSSGGPIELLTTTTCPGGVFPCPGTSVSGAPGTSGGAPTWVTADGVSISGVGPFGFGTCPASHQGDCRFFGTSSSVGHAAAIDALFRQALGGVPTVAGINGAMARYAVDRGVAGRDDVFGAGVLSAPPPKARAPALAPAGLLVLAAVLAALGLLALRRRV